MSKVLTHQFKTKSGVKFALLDNAHHIGSVLKYVGGHITKPHVVSGMVFKLPDTEKPFNDTSWKILLHSARYLQIDRVSLRQSKDHCLLIGPRLGYRGVGPLLSALDYHDVIINLCDNFRRGPVSHVKAKPADFTSRIYDSIDYVHGRNIIVVVCPKSRLAEAIDMDQFGRPTYCFAYPLKRRPPFKSIEDAMNAADESFEHPGSVQASFNLSLNPKSRGALIADTHVNGTPVRYYDAWTLMTAVDDCSARVAIQESDPTNLQLSKSSDGIKRQARFFNREEHDFEQAISHNQHKIKRLEHSKPRHHK